MNGKEILFFKHLHGMASPEEEKKIQILLNLSAENMDEMDNLGKVSEIEKQIEALSSHDTEKGYERMMKKVRKYETRRHIIKIALTTCAILVFPLLISVTALSVINIRLEAQLENQGWQEIKATPGTIVSAELPDRSKVWINSGSTLRYPSRFKKGKREVQMNGEAYFEVMSDKENPFCVRTPAGLDIVAHGTRFNVTAYQDDTNETEVTLAEGSVSVLINGSEKCQLNPGEACLFIPESESIQINNVNINEKIAWTEGKIIFRNASLEEVFRRLGRRYNVDFIFHDPYNLSDNYRCRITFKNETIQQAMNYLQIAAPIKFTDQPTTITSNGMLHRQRIDVWLDDLQKIQNKN